jgi:hypothetical protein
MLEFFIPLLDAAPHWWVLSELGPEILLHSQSRLFTPTQTCKKAFSTPITIIFIQLAPLAATNKTKHPLHEQINL